MSIEKPIESNHLKNEVNALFLEEKNFIAGIPHKAYLKSQFRYFFNLLQNIYFNGNDITPLNKLCYPFSISQHPTVTKLISQIEKIRQLDTPNYQRQTSLEDFLINNHSFLTSLENNIGSIESKTIKNNLNTELYKSTDKKYFQHLIILIDKIKNLKNDCLDSVILSNSMVTMDYCKGYSDLDILLIINKKAFKSKSTLRKCRAKIIKVSKHLYLHDPTQHHGFFIFNSNELMMYTEATYPTLLHNYSSLISGSNKINYKFIDDSFEKKVFLYRSIMKLISFIDTPNNSFDIFKLKDFVSQVTLFPVLFIQAKEDYIYKRDAFKNLNKYFKSIEAFKIAEEIRQNFPYKRVRFWPNFIHPTVLPLFHKKRHSTELLLKIEPLKKEVLVLISECLINLSK